MKYQSLIECRGSVICSLFCVQILKSIKFSLFLVCKFATLKKKSYLYTVIKKITDLKVGATPKILQKNMKTIYLLTHTHQVKDVVATFTDLKKAEEAFDIFSDYINSNYGVLSVEQELCYERKEKGYCSFRNGHILRIEENRIFTDINSFKKIL